MAEFGGSSHLLPIDVFANRPVSTDAQWDALTSGSNELGKIADSAGMRLSYHHHMGTGVMTRADVDRLMAATDPSPGPPAARHRPRRLRRRRSAGPGPGLRRPHRPRPPEEHPARGREPGREEGLSFQEGVELGVFTVPGDGAIDFRPILEVLADADYQGWLVVEAEQDPNKAVPLEYAKKARAYLADILGW